MLLKGQKTLEATIDWSYQLLSEEEQVLVRRLAVFAGGWSLEAAEAMGADLVQPQTDVLELLSRLVGKSMVLAEEPGENEPNVLRYRFLETIREYTEEKLIDAGEADVARTRHRDLYLGLAERAMEGMEGAEQKSWWDRLELEHDNLRVAVRWSAADPSRSAAVLGFAGLLRRFWQTRGYVHEWLGWLESAVAGSAATPSVPGVRALSSLGQNETDDGNIERGQLLLAESVRQARTLGDRRVLSLALRHFGMGLMVAGDYAQARGPIEEAVAVSRAAGIKREIAWLRPCPSDARCTPLPCACTPRRLANGWRASLVPSTRCLPTAASATGSPDLPLTVGLDGGYVHSSQQRSRRDGWFEVIAGKSMPTDGPAKCFGFVQTSPSGGCSRC